PRRKYAAKRWRRCASAAASSAPTSRKPWISSTRAGGRARTSPPAFGPARSSSASASSARGTCSATASRNDSERLMERDDLAIDGLLRELARAPEGEDHAFVSRVLARTRKPTLPHAPIVAAAAILFAMGLF